MEQQNLADRIQQLRKQNSLSQEQLAEKLNVSRQAVSKWESAQAQPDLERIVALSELFSVTTDFLLKGSRGGRDGDGRTAPPEGAPAPGHRPDAAFASRVLYLAALFFIGIGLVCALAAWYEKQTADCIAGGMVVQAIGAVCYGVGRMLSAARPARWMVKAGCAAGLFLPLAVLAWQLDPLIPVPHYSIVTEGSVMAVGYAIVLTLLTRLHILDRL